MLRRSGVYAIRALLELALEPPRWRSVRDLAEAQGLPAPMLEQLLLRLRRAGLLESRRGRRGGYRLREAPAAVPLAAILAAVTADAGESPGPEEPAAGAPAGSVPLALVPAAADPADQVTAALEQRLRQAVERELARLTLAELVFDLHSARASLSEEGGLLLG